MQFADLTLEKIIMEVRYNQAFRYWDIAGKTMSLLVAKYPKIELRDAQISNVQSDWSDEGITINFNNLKLDVTQDFPKGLETFKGVSTALCEVVRQELDIKAFTRVGLRTIHSLPTKTAAEARELMEKTGLVRFDPDKLQHFGKGKIEETQALVRYESDDKGCSVRVTHTSRDIAMKVPRPFTLDLSKFNKEGLLLDVDFYTKKAVEGSVFSAPDFIRLNYRTLEQNLLSLVGL